MDCSKRKVLEEDVENKSKDTNRKKKKPNNNTDSTLLSDYLGEEGFQKKFAEAFRLAKNTEFISCFPTKI